MGDVGDVYNDVRDHRRAMRGAFGIACPRCKEKRPRAQPSILLPQQACRVDGYRDPRPRLTQEQERAALSSYYGPPRIGAGITCAMAGKGGEK